MKKISTCLSLLLVFALLLTSVPAYASANGESQAVHFEKVNPLYEHTLSLEDAREHYASVPSASNENTENAVSIYSADEAAEYIRQAMVGRENEISFLYTAPDNYDYWEQSDLVNSVFDLALEETGVPTEGDYLRFQWEYWNCSVNVSSDNDNYYYLITYDMLYYTTKEQEQAVSEAVEQILSQLNLDGKADYEKARAIYHYLVTTVTYDYETLYEDDYTLKYTAYAALIRKTAICQGYAAALYRLLMEADIPSRIILGTSGTESHSWNLVQIDGHWYYADSTWESISYSEGDDFSWFLLGEEDFTSHTRDTEYQTEDFLAAYPVENENYTPDIFTLQQPSVTASNTSGGITIQWSEISGASGYYIYQKTSGGWEKIKTITDGSIVKWTHTDVTNGSKYTYTVCAFNGDVKSTYMSGRSIYCLSQPAVSSLKNPFRRTIAVKWNRNTAASGYQIQYFSIGSPSSSKTAVISKNTVISKTLSRLITGKRYYVRIRSYKTVFGATYYSAWSNVTNIKVSR